MRNRYPGVCYYCRRYVAVGAGHFERRRGQWFVIHVECVLEKI